MPPDGFPSEGAFWLFGFGGRALQERGATSDMEALLETVEQLFQSTRPVWGATANLTILPRQICTKGTKEFLLGRKTHGKKEK